jgi:hypothetical protein
MSLYYAVRPKIGLEKKREIGSPIAQESFYDVPAVDWRILVKRSQRKALFQNSSRCHRSARDQYVSFRLFEQASDQGEGGKALSDARTVNPDQLSLRTLERISSKSLGEAMRVLFSPRCAIAEHWTDKRGEHPPEQPISAEREAASQTGIIRFPGQGSFPLL